MSSVVAMMVVAPLWLGGCKKKVEEAPPKPVAEAQDVKVFFPTVRAEGDKVVVTMEIHNTTKNYLAMELAEIRMFHGDDQICSGKVPLGGDRLGAGLQRSVKIEALECPWSKHDGKVSVKGTVKYENMSNQKKEFELKPRDLEITK